MGGSLSSHSLPESVHSHVDFDPVLVRTALSVFPPLHLQRHRVTVLGTEECTSLVDGLRLHAIEIARALQSVEASAIAARQRVDELACKAALLSAAVSDAEISDALAEISALEVKNTVALEAAAVRIDGALELAISFSESRGASPPAALLEALKSISDNPSDGSVICVSDTKSSAHAGAVRIRVCCPIVMASDLAVLGAARALSPRSFQLLCELAVRRKVVNRQLVDEWASCLSTALPQLRVAIAVVSVGSDGLLAAEALHESKLSISLSSTNHRRRPSHSLPSIDVHVDLSGVCSGSYVVFCGASLNGSPISCSYNESNTFAVLVAGLMASSAIKSLGRTSLPTEPTFRGVNYG